MNFGRTFKDMPWMTFIIQTLVLLFWILFLWPQILAFAGFNFQINDPFMLGSSLFTGLMVSVFTFSLLNYKKGYK